MNSVSLSLSKVNFFSSFRRGGRSYKKSYRKKKNRFYIFLMCGSYFYFLFFLYKDKTYKNERVKMFLAIVFLF